MKAFAPLLLFVVLFLGTGTYFHLQNIPFAFYQLPAPIAAIPAIVLALWFMKGSVEERLNAFIEGMGDNNILTMCLIYLLAGAFGVITKSSGAVDSAVGLGLQFIPASFLLPGIFILASLLSLSMGTSMGAISAIGPIAFGLVQKSGLPAAEVFGALVGGAMFGDNLSFISDTTIAATRTQGCSMKDKFKENFKLAFPAALVTVAILYFTHNQSSVIESSQIEWYKITPYLLILVLAITGMNVFAVLSIGLISAGMIALISIPDYSLLKLSQDAFNGFKEMQEIFILSLFMGGLGRLMKLQGGIDLMKNYFEKLSLKIGKQTKFHRVWSELSLSASILITNFAVANNTVAILICGDLFKEISEIEKIEPKRSASILDIFSCVAQGIIPYGAQILLASQIAKLSPLEVAGKVYYCYLLGLVVLINIFFQKNRPKTT